MTRSTTRSYTVVATLALSSLFAFAAEKPADTQQASTQPKTEQVCEVHPEYSCVEVPTAYGYQSYKQAKAQKAAYAKNDKAGPKRGSASSSNLSQNGN